MAGDAAGRGLVVAGEHHHLRAEFVQSLHRRRRGRTGGVGDADDGRGATIHRYRDGRTATVGNLVAASGENREVDTLAFDQASVAHCDPVTVDHGDGSLAGYVLEAHSGGPRHSVGLGMAHDGFGKGMFGLAFDRGDETKQFAFINAVDDYVSDLGLAFGECAGLVHDDSVDAGRGLDGGGLLEQHTPAGAEARADHDRRWSSQAERIGAGDDDDGDGEQHRRRYRSTADGRPRGEGERAADEGDEHQPERGPVGQSLPGGLGVLGVLHEFDDLGQGRVGAHLGRPYP